MDWKEQDKLIDEWVALRNEHIGETVIPRVGPIPTEVRAMFGTLENEYVTTDLIRHYCDGCGERNPLYRNEEYAKKTRWGGIIGPPGVTDAIGEPYIGWEDHAEHPIRYKIDRIRYLPNGSRRELFIPIRHGDKFRCVDKYLGMKEWVQEGVERPAPARQFDETVLRTFINQRDEVAATYERHMNIVCNQDWREYPDYGWRKRHMLTAEEREDIHRGYNEEKRRGAEILFWEDVKEGEKVNLHKVGPYEEWDSAAVLTVLAGHAAAFEVAHDYFAPMGAPPPEPVPEKEIGSAYGERLDPRFNGYIVGGRCHFVDDDPGARMYSGGPAVGFYSQIEWLLCRMLTNWIGDDGWVKVLDDRVPIYPVVGDVFCCSGEVTGKRVEGDEHLVDLNVRCKNMDDVLLVHGTATVRLLSRDDRAASRAK